MWLAALCLSGCETNAPTEPTPSKPFWLSKPRLPERPKDFCIIASSQLRDTLAATQIRCSETLAGANGIRGKTKYAEIVILQGANEEWTAFAYLAGGITQSHETPSEAELNEVVARIEAAFDR
ncbi:hypothetical protein C7451_10441 [Blastomonas natatoria]|uniref:Uncharacterized protein n=2 Tax=Blastomonas natatoria TaxID=34015 RepID=A0A2V3V9Y0_9SPHN|nr:hypothetical protein C7451_10441 [Blastomonas natatoria]